MRRAALAAMLAAQLCSPGAWAGDAPLRVQAPEALIASGFMQHILPRFRFRTRISAEAQPGPEEADAALTEAVGGARPVMTSADGRAYEFDVLAAAPDRQALAEKLGGWLRSPAGRRAIEGFEIDDAPAFAAGEAAPAPVETVELDGDAHAGARLALVHCGRCHVVDQRNRTGGIGSTPSFAALRAMPEWHARFVGFWALNPHPAFTQVEGLTEPFDPLRPPHIAPIHMTQEDADAIAAYVATLEPKDLGADVQAR